MSTTDNSTRNDSKISTTVNTIMIDNSIIAFNLIIQRSTEIGLMSEEKVNELQDMLTRDRINTEVLNAILNFNESFLVLYDCLTSSASASSRASSIASADVANSNV